MAKQKLHYDKDALLQDYEATFGRSLKWMTAFFVVVFIFFFALMVGLGVGGHEPYDEFYQTFSTDDPQFGPRIEIEYDGTKLPSSDLVATDAQ